MFGAIAKHIVEGNSYFGLEIFQANDRELFSLLQMKLKKGELEVVLEKTSEDLKELVPLINSKAPLFLTINTSKVLKKETLKGGQGEAQHIVIDAFPNLELDNFYYQILHGVANDVVAISKKDYVELYLKKLENIGLKPYSLVLGASQITNIQGFIKGELTGSNFTVSINEIGIDQFKLSNEHLPESIELEGITVNSNSLLSFAHIIGHLQNAVQVNNLVSKNNLFDNDFKNRRVFDFGIKSSVLIFLVLLLGNFLLFNTYHSKNQMLESSLIAEGQNDNALVNLKKRVLLKEERVNALASSKNSNTSYYLDEIAKRLPKSIWLSDMKFQPLLFPVRNDKPIDFNKNNLEISGIINDKIAFTVWSDNLETEKWVDKVEIIDYEYISSSSANFTINIVINEVQ